MPFGNATINYTGSAVFGADFNWNFSNANIVNNSGSTNYEINFPTSGSFDISLQVEENGCVSTLETRTIVVEEPLDAIVNNCSSTASEVTFDWADISGASGYRVNSISGQTGVLNGSSYAVSNLSANEEVTIEIIAESATGCSDVSSIQTCETQNCAVVNLSIEVIDNICLSAGTQPVQLRVRRNGGFRPGNYVWSGAGVNVAGQFNPAVAGVGTHPVSVSLTEGICTYTSTIDIIVFEKPNADFAAPAEICVTENAIIAYVGSAAPSANFSWNFNGASIVNNSGSTNYEINFPTNGNFDISLQIEENGCISDVNTQNIQVDFELEKPQISCSASQNEIVFEWQNINGADDYEVISLSGQTGILDGNKYTVSGLAQNEEVEILVRANGQTICGASEETATCTAKVCPPLNLNIDPIPQPICEGESLDISLSANPLGGIGNGDFFWSGPNVTSDGFFNTATLPAGQHTVLLNYSENNCQYTDLLFFSIAPSPNIIEEISPPIWFPGREGDINLTVQKGLPPYSFAWNNGAISQNLINTIPSPYSVTVTDANGCESQENYVLGLGIFRVSPVHIICRGDSKELFVRPNRGADFEWSPNAGLSCDDCAETIASPSQSTTYNISATLNNGRTASTNILIIILPQSFCALKKSFKNIEDQLLTEFDFSKNINSQKLATIENRILEIAALKTDSKLVFEQKNQVNIFPNPTSGMVNIVSDSDIQNVRVFDFSGKVILEKQDSEIDLSLFPKGVYIFKIKTDKEEFVKRVVFFD